MRYNKILVLSTLFLILFLSIGITTASENITSIESVNINIDDNLTDYTPYYEDSDEYIEDYGEDEGWEEDIEDDDEDLQHAEIIETTIYDDDDLFTQFYDGQMFSCKIKDFTGFVDDADVYLEDENGNIYEGYYDQDLNEYWFDFRLPVGNHSITLFLDDGWYIAEPITHNSCILAEKFDGKVSCKSYYGTAKNTLTMKAIVTNYFEEREDGIVTFKVNGKSYMVKTKNGVATKKIKINKAGTFTYTATFKSENYLSSGSGKAKLYVYSTSKKARTIKIKKYKIIIPIKKI